MAISENIFQESCLIQLSITCWSNDKKLPQTILEDIGNTEYIRGRKILLDPEDISSIKKIAGQARNWLRTIALPFPIHGCMLVPKKTIPVIQEKLNYFQNIFDSYVEDFIAFYPESIENARNSLGPLFSDLDYPSDREIKTKFRFEWRYITIGHSNANVLPPSLYREEVSKFQSLMEQAREEAIVTLRTEFVDLVSNLCDKVSGSEDGKPKRLKSAAVENLQQFLNDFSNRNLFQDEQLAELVEKCNNIISGTSANSIRTNTQVKESIHTEMEELLNQIDKQFEDLPRRKLRFAA